MDNRWLVLRLDAPLMAFGGILIDQVGPVRDFPAASMLTGLIGNAMGWHWSDRAEHQRLQDRLVFAARRDREGMILTDSQNVRLQKSDTAWTTYGRPEGRFGASYGAPHRRFRDYHADTSLRVVLHLARKEQDPTLEEVAVALDRPKRPLFLGRKPCIPSAPLLANEPERWVTGRTAHAALCSVQGSGKRCRALWPVGEGPQDGSDVDRIFELADLRNWHTGLHAGSRRVVQGYVRPEASP